MPLELQATMCMNRLIAPVKLCRLSTDYKMVKMKDLSGVAGGETIFVDPNSLGVYATTESKTPDAKSEQSARFLSESSYGVNR